MLNVHLLTIEDYQSITEKIKELEGKLALLLEEKQQSSKGDYLTVKEFLAEVKVSRGTFENMKNESNPSKFRVNCIKRGNKIYVPKGEVKRFYTFY
jgi:hypothetical protein